MLFRSCWLFRIVPKEMSDYDKTLVADKEIPAFKILKDENSNILAHVGSVQMPLKALISNLLARKLKFCEHIRSAPKQKVTIIFFEMKCWKCGTPQYCYTVEPSLKSVCDCDFDVERSCPLADGTAVNASAASTPDRKSTRLNSSHPPESRMPSSA